MLEWTRRHKVAIGVGAAALAACLALMAGNPEIAIELWDFAISFITETPR